jgi:chaperonin GroEL (HSP60 family)
VLLVDGDLQARTLSRDVRIDLDSAAAAGRTTEALVDSEGIAAAIAAADAVAVVATGDVDMAVAKELARHGAVVLRNVKRTDFEYVMRATGASPRGPVRPGETVAPDDLGVATVRLRDAGRDDDWIAFEPPAAATAPAVTLLVRGGTRSAAEEAQRRVRDGKNALRACVLDPRALPAGGAVDAAAAADLRSFAPRFDGREQLAVEAVADVLETIPRTLARNAGLEPLGALADLRTRHGEGRDRAGVSSDGVVVDDVTAGGGGLDAFGVRVSGLVRAVEVANSLVRIDATLLDEREPSVDRVLPNPTPEPDEGAPDPD